jgi:hypothetical protein
MFQVKNPMAWDVRFNEIHDLRPMILWFGTWGSRNPFIQYNNSLLRDVNAMVWSLRTFGFHHPGRSFHGLGHEIYGIQ